MLHRKILLALAAILVLQGLANFVKYLHEVQESGYFGSDFMVFWKAAGEALRGQTEAIYDSGNMLAPFAYPPYILLLLWPFALLTYGVAVALWSLLPLLLFYPLLYGMQKRGEEKNNPAGGLPFRITAAFMLPFLLPNIFTGQTGAVIAVLFLGAAYSANRSELLLGLCIGLMTIKPQFAFLLPLGLVASQQWRALFFAAAMFLALLLFSTLGLSSTIWEDYFHMMQQFAHYMLQGSGRFNQLAVSPYVSLHGAGVSIALAGAVQGAITAGMLATTFLIFRRGNGPQDVRYGLLACAVLLATPYGLCYDTPILALALLPLLSRLWQRGFASLGEVAALAMLAVMPYAEPVFYPYHVPFGLLTLLMAFGVLWRLYRTESR